MLKETLKKAAFIPYEKLKEKHVKEGAGLTDWGNSNGNHLL